MEGCQKISNQEYESQKIDYTKKALEELNQQLQQSKPNKLRNRKCASNKDIIVENHFTDESNSESDSEIELLSDINEEDIMSNKITIISGSRPKKKVKKTDSNDKVMSEFMNTFSDLNKNNSNSLQEISNLKSKNSAFKKEINSLEKKLHYLKLEHSNSTVEYNKIKEKYIDIEEKNKLLTKKNKEVLSADFWFQNTTLVYKYSLYISLIFNTYFYLFYW